MKKLFISCPMKGRTEENIKETMHRRHKAAEAIVGEELEVIPSYIEDNPPKDSKEAVWYLGESIKKLSEADYIVCIEPNWDYAGCATEDEVAIRYDITRIRLPLYLVAPDIHEVRMETVSG